MVDVSDPATPQLRGQSLAGYGDQLYVRFPFLYLSGGSAGFRILDVSDPDNPEEVGYYTVSTLDGVYANDKYIYLGTAAYGFYVLDFTPVAIEGGGAPEPGIPGNFLLHQNYPNPFNPETTISFDIPGEPGTKQQVRLIVYDLRGREVKTLVDSRCEPGSHRVVWDGRNERGEPVSSGIYFYSLTAGEHTTARKMIVMK